MMEIIHFTIPLVPKTKKYPRLIFYNTRGGKSRDIQSETYKDYERKVKNLLPKHDTINEPVNVKCLFYMPTQQRVDLTNLEAAIHDIMVQGELLQDDNRDIIAATDGTRCYYDPDNPRTEVYITTKENYEQWRKEK